MFYYKIIFIFALVCLPAAITRANSRYQSAAHVGIAVAQKSSTGFQDAVGSVLMFDVLRNFDNGLAFGFRTNSQGGGDRFNFYRMSAGPLLSYNFYTNWRIHAHFGTFRESANMGPVALYRSRGSAGMLGWERGVSFKSGLELVYGGYLALHSGDLRYEGLSAKMAGIPRANINTGTSRGFEVGLNLPL